jgi:hypothetical protein
MKRWIARVAVPAVLAGGVIAVVAAPAQAVWVSGGVYALHSTCDAVGAARLKSGMYDTYLCESQSPGWWLRGWV